MNGGIAARSGIRQAQRRGHHAVRRCWEAFKNNDGYGQLTLDLAAPVSHSAPLLTEPDSEAFGDAAYFILDLTDVEGRLVGIEVEGAPNVYPEEIAARWNEAEKIRATANVGRVPDGIRVVLGAAEASRSVEVAAGGKHHWLRLELHGERLVGLVFLGEDRRVVNPMPRIFVSDFGERRARKIRPRWDNLHA